MGPAVLGRRDCLFKFARLSAGAGATVWLAGCAAPSPAAKADKKNVKVSDGHGTLVAPGRFESTPWSFSTNSYVIEGPTGLILVDTQFLTSEANAFVDAAEKAFGKPAELAVVLHANPDKFNGTAAMQARNIRVVTSAQVLALIPAVHQKRLKAFYKRYKPDYPKAEPAPESFGAVTTTIQAGGTEVTCHVTGAGCSEAHVLLTHDDESGERHLFAGDLLANKAHAWLEIGKSDQWLARLGEMRALNPARAYPGRGPAAGPALVDEQEAYLTAVREEVAKVVAAERAGEKFDSKQRVIERVEARYPDHRFAVFLRIGIPAELERERQAPTLDATALGRVGE